MMSSQEEDVAENVGHLFVKFFSDLFFGFVFLTTTPSHHEVTLDELTHFFLELQDVPVGIPTDAKLFGVLIGDFFNFSRDFMDVHGGIIA